MATILALVTAACAIVSPATAQAAVRSAAPPVAARLEPLPAPYDGPPDDAANVTPPPEPAAPVASRVPAESWWALEDRVRDLRGQADALDRHLREARDASWDVPLARSRSDLELARSYLGRADAMSQAGEDLAGAELWADLASFSLQDGGLLLTPSSPVEARGILIDAGSLPQTREEVRQLVDRLADAHFNLLLPEIIRRGYAIYKSAILDRDPAFARSPDLLPDLIAEAHRRGLEVVPWIWSFRVRSCSSDHDYGNPVLSRYPDLAARAEDSLKPRFMSPANPLARQFVLDEAAEIVKRYDVDGLFLDYIRYDEQTPDDWTSRTLFALTRLDDMQRHLFTRPATIDIRQSAKLARDYQIWRERQVDETVSRVHDLLTSQHRPLDLGVATFRDEWYSRQTKLQDWRNWADNKWTTFTTEMLYSAHASAVGRWIDEETDGDRRPTLLYPILGALRMDHPQRDLPAEIQAVRAHGMAGFFLFSLSHLDDSDLAELARGPLRRPAVIPQRDLLGAAHRELAETLWGYLHRQPFPEGDWGTIAAARVLASELATVMRTWPHKMHSKIAFSTLEERLAELADAARAMDRANASFAAEMAHRLVFAADLVRAYDYRLEKRGYVAPTLPPLESFLRPTAGHGLLTAIRASLVAGRPATSR